MEIIGLGIVADVVPTVVGNEGVGLGGGDLQERVGRPGQRRPIGKRFGEHPHRQDEEIGRRGHAAERVIGAEIRPALTGGIGHGRRLAAAAGDDPGDVRAVPIGVHQGISGKAKDARTQVRMRGVHARVVDVHQHIGATQTKVVVRGRHIHSHPDAHPAHIVGRRPRQRPFHLLHPAQPGNGRQAVHRRPHAQHQPERGTLFIPQDPGAQFLQVRPGRLARIRKDQHVERAVAGQRILRHRQIQQRQL